VQSHTWVVDLILISFPQRCKIDYTKQILRTISRKLLGKDQGSKIVLKNLDTYLENPQKSKF